MSNGPATSYDLERLLTAARLPALPNSAIRVMELARDPKNGPAELAVPIEADPGLTGQVLRFLNSSYFGFANEISSVKLAISMVGVRTIKNFVLWSAVFSLMPNPRCGPFDLKTLWQDSLRRGLFARIIAKRIAKKEAEDAFSAGLLQDMAVPLLAKALPREYHELLTMRREGKGRLSQLERARFGWDHADAASIIARQWRFPLEFSQLLGNHTKFNPRGGEGMKALLPIVSLSALLPSATDAGWYELPVFEQAYEALPLSPRPAIAELLQTTDVEFAEIAPILKLQKSTRPLVDFYQQAAAAV